MLTDLNSSWDDRLFGIMNSEPLDLSDDYD